jgi:hypothetical protein
MADDVMPSLTAYAHEGALRAATYSRRSRFSPPAITRSYAKKRRANAQNSTFSSSSFPREEQMRASRHTVVARRQHFTADVI